MRMDCSRVVLNSRHATADARQHARSSTVITNNNSSKLRNKVSQRRGYERNFSRLHIQLIVFKTGNVIGPHARTVRNVIKNQ